MLGGFIVVGVKGWARTSQDYLLSELIAPSQLITHTRHTSHITVGCHICITPYHTLIRCHTYQKYFTHTISHLTYIIAILLSYYHIHTIYYHTCLRYHRLVNKMSHIPHISHLTTYHIITRSIHIIHTHITH